MSVGYLETTKKYTVKDYYNDWWVQADLTVTVDADGNGSWEIKMTNDQDGSSCTASLVFSINGVLIFDEWVKTPPKANTTTLYDRGKGFPVKDDSIATGTFTVSSGSFKIGLAVCRSQAAVTHDTDTNRNRLVNGAAARIGTEKLNPDGANWTAYHITFNRNYYTIGGKPTVSIQNKGDNKFKIGFTTGDPGQYNERAGIIVYYTIDGSNPKTSSNRFTACNVTNQHTISGTSGTYSITKDLTLKTYAVNKFKFGPETASDVLTDNLKYYAVPTIEQAPVITCTKNKLTVREPWTVSWKGKEGNSNTPIQGYYVFIYQNGNNIMLVDDSDQILSKQAHNNEWAWNTKSSTITISPKANNFKAEDEITIKVIAWGKNGAGDLMLSSPSSCTETIENAGIVRVKVNNVWREGQVWVKAGGTWHEAETVFVKTSTGWKESQ